MGCSLYKETGKGISAITMKKWIPQLKRKEETEWLKETYSQCLQSSVINLGIAYKNFFEKRGGYPRFKSRYGKQSLQYPQNVKVVESGLYFPKIGEIKANLHRLFDGELKTVTVSKTKTDKYYASLLFDDGAKDLESNANGKVLGIDLGISSYCSNYCPIFTPIVERFKNPAALILFSLIFLYILALAAVVIGLEALLGAFAAGLVLGGMSIKERLAQLFEPFVYVYTTIFFVTIGARVDLSIINPFIPENREGLIIAACLIIIAVIGKIAAGFVTFTDKPINRLAVGIGMIPRGEVGLVFAGLGAATGILSEALNAAVIVMVIVTTLIAPVLLRLVFSSPSKELTVEKILTILISFFSKHLFVRIVFCRQH